MHWQKKPLEKNPTRESKEVGQRCSAKSNESRYRPEIDGLRAFAVIAVIINHFNKDLLPGGYLGVDIFFVISGYVITSSLATRQSANLWDFATSFYERRIKRLAPALITFVLITSVLISLFNPDPDNHLMTGYRSLLGISNISLYRQSTDYFSQSSELNPFTHTWSLGVEEQFYLFFPFMVWFSGFGQQKANGVRNLLISAGALSVASLLIFVHTYQTNQPAAYFLMPYRFWEMAAGSLVFAGLQYKTLQKHIESTSRPLVVLAGMISVMIIPKYAAVPATIATVALTCVLIASLRRETSAYNLLTQKHVVYIGLISYSLYLWHWTVLSISRWTIGIHWWTAPAQIILMLLLAILSYHLIETPFRNLKSVNRQLNIGVGMASLLMAFAFSINLKNSWHRKVYLGDSDESLVQDLSIECKREKKGAHPVDKCILYPGAGKKQKIVIIGDSYSFHLLPLLQGLHNKVGVGIKGMMTFGQILPPTPFIDVGIDRQTWVETSNMADKFIHSIGNDLQMGDIIIFSSRLEHYFIDTQNAKGGLEHWSDKLKTMAQSANKRGVNIVIFKPIPVFKGGEAPPSLCNKQWFRPVVHPSCSSKYTAYRSDLVNRFKNINNNLDNIASSHKNVFLYDSFDLFCPGSSVACKSTLGALVTYKDDNHLSEQGASLLIDDFLHFLQVNNLLMDDPSRPAHSIKASNQ